jgi:hypothetical protein
MINLPWRRRGAAAPKASAPKDETPARFRRTVFAGPTGKPLDLLMPPPYDLSGPRQEEDRAKVERLVGSLKPNAVDAGSREVLVNLINELTEQSLAELKAQRDERHAIGRVLVGMAAEELTRRRHRFDVDATAASHAGAALGLAYEALTGRKADERILAGPSASSRERLESGVGAVDLRLEDPPQQAPDRIELHLDDPADPSDRNEHHDDHR